MRFYELDALADAFRGGEVIFCHINDIRSLNQRYYFFDFYKEEGVWKMSIYYVFELVYGERAIRCDESETIMGILYGL